MRDTSQGVIAFEIMLIVLMVLVSWSRPDYPGLDLDDPCAYCGERSAEWDSEFCDGCDDRVARRR